MGEMLYLGVRLLAGTLYPAYCSFKAVKNKNVKVRSRRRGSNSRRRGRNMRNLRCECRSRKKGHAPNVQWPILLIG